MASRVLNPETLSGIAHNSFYGELQEQEGKRIYPKICEIINQTDITTTYTTFGSPPEPRRLSGTQAATGARQAYGMKDYIIAGTVVEWEQTIEIPRATIETNPDEIPRQMRMMAAKASMFMDRRLIGTILNAATLGYDGVALISATHGESGTNQDNDFTDNIADPAAPTGAELEAILGANIAFLKGVTDDRLTPVNEGASRFQVIMPNAAEFIYRSVLEPVQNQAQGGLDISGGTGKFRGMFEVLPSAFSGTNRHYVFAADTGRKAVALLKNKDFEFKTNIGTDSDIWNLGQMAVFHSYARWEFIPWDWHAILYNALT